jgi:hypothetical protein
MSANDKFAARSPKEWDNEVLRLETKLDETTRIGIELGRELELTKMELERWRHGKQIEGDYVCPDSLALTAAKTEIKNLQDQILGEHEALAKELGPSIIIGDYVGQIRTLKRKMEETEKAGADIRTKNEALVTSNKQVKLERERYERTLSAIAKSVGMKLPYKNVGSGFERALEDGELEELMWDVCRITDPPQKEPVHYKTPFCGICDTVVSVAKSDDIDKVTCNICRVRWREKYPEDSPAKWERTTPDEVNLLKKQILELKGRLAAHRFLLHNNQFSPTELLEAVKKVVSES